MKTVYTLSAVDERARSGVGGKAYALARMARAGLSVPDAVCVSVEAYNAYVDETGLRGRIMMELSRKPFEEMRWEEMWDTSLRIRNLFVKTDMPAGLKKSIEDAVQPYFCDAAVSVRSSAPGEDSGETSYAGLHESYICVEGMTAVLERIRMVWASLWSDRALLYRRELKLDIDNSAMAVVVQKMVCGDRSGIVFGVNPLDDSQGVVEAVYGLNQGLVEGSVQPDRWLISRTSREIIAHVPAIRERSLVSDDNGTRLAPLPADLADEPPLCDREVRQVYDCAGNAETLFGRPQDVEWTFENRRLVTLQSRPITVSRKQGQDERRWYLSLHRSFDNLKKLRNKIEQEIMPAMKADADAMVRRDVNSLSDLRLAGEIGERSKTLRKWEAAYSRDCIPFAHGMRLFGRLYNDVMHPSDPYEFMDFLAGSGLQSVERNRMLAELARRLKDDPGLRTKIEKGSRDGCDPECVRLMDALYDTYGDQAWGTSRLGKDLKQLLVLLLQWPAQEAGREGSRSADLAEREAQFIARFNEQKTIDASELIELARASYRFRDDDNTYLGRIAGQLGVSVEEGKRRISEKTGLDVERFEAGQVARVLAGSLDPSGIKMPASATVQRPGDFEIRPRQLTGQPSVSGVAVGSARVVTGHEDLFAFQSGEVLVCDAVDPNMTFVVPLAAGIVERRGGMLIHGAIIAREYGIPCVTGVVDAASLIHTGDTVTVDGFLGIVVIGQQRNLPA